MSPKAKSKDLKTGSTSMIMVRTCHYKAGKFVTNHFGFFISVRKLNTNEISGGEYSKRGESVRGLFFFAVGEK